MALACSLVGACQKDPDPATDTALLTSRPWIVEKAEEKDGGTPWVDVFPYWAACDKDNTWIFKTDQSLEFNEAATACSPNSPNQVLEVVTWELSADHSKIIVDGLQYEILQLDAASLVVLVTETYGGVESSRRVTFKH